MKIADAKDKAVAAEQATFGSITKGVWREPRNCVSSQEETRLLQKSRAQVQPWVDYV